MSTDYGAKGWLAKTLQNISAPLNSVFKEGTFAYNVSNLFGGWTGVPGPWFQTVDYITGDRKISDSGDAWEFGRRVFQTGLWDEMDEAAWKYGGPAITGYYGGPVAAAGASYFGNKLSGEDDETAAKGAATSYALGSVLGAGEGAGGSEGGLFSGISDWFSGSGEGGGFFSNLFSTEGAGNVSKLASMFGGGGNKEEQPVANNSNGNSIFGALGNVWDWTNQNPEHFSLLTGTVGDALNPQGPLAGQGVSLAQKSIESKIHDQEQKKREQMLEMFRAYNDEQGLDLNPSRKATQAKTTTKPGLSILGEPSTAGSVGTKTAKPLSTPPASVNPKLEMFLTPEQRAAIQKDRLTTQQLAIDLDKEAFSRGLNMRRLQQGDRSLELEQARLNETKRANEAREKLLNTKATKVGQAETRLDPFANEKEFMEMYEWKSRILQGRGVFKTGETNNPYGQVDSISVAAYNHRALQFGEHDFMVLDKENKPVIVRFAAPYDTNAIIEQLRTKYPGLDMDRLLYAAMESGYAHPVGGGNGR